MKTRALMRLLPGAFLSLACASSTRSAKSVAQETPDSIDAPTTIITEREALSAPELLARGQEHLKAKRYQQAAQDFRLVVENTTDQDERLRALFGWGTALDLGSDPQGALRQYSRYVAEASPGPQRERAQVRVVRLLVYLERYEEAEEIAASLELSARTPLEQVALLSAMALGSVRKDDLDEAEDVISRGRLIVDQKGFDRVTVPPLDVAALYFALGELRRIKAARIQFDPLPDDFAVALEERCQLILDSQAAYSEAMRSQDAHWSSMSGVRVGQLYQHLHRDLMSMPSPGGADSQERKQLFEGALRLRYSILLRKSLSMMQATVELLERTQHQSKWGKRAKEALDEIEDAHLQEEAVIDALPYSRAQLQQVLDHMASRAASPATPSAATP